MNQQDAAADQGDRELAVRYEEALRRAGASVTARLAELGECQCRLADLVRARMERNWTPAEHTSYLRLRRMLLEQHGRMAAAQRAFDRVRGRLQELSIDPDGDGTANPRTGAHGPSDRAG